MGKQVSLILSEDAWDIVKEKLAEVNRDFDGGRLKPCDVVNEMILTSKIDVKALQGKHINLKKLLRSLANKKDIEIDMVLKLVGEAKGKISKRKPGNEEGI